MNADDNREALYELADRFVTDRPLKSEIETFGQFDRRHFREFLSANRDAVLRALGMRERVRTSSGPKGYTGPVKYQRRFETEWEDVTDE